MNFYTGENILPKVSLYLRGAENDPQTVDDCIANLYLKSLPQFSFSVKWEAGGGAVLADKLTEFANPTAVKFLRGAAYKTPASNGKWTARTVKGADHLTLSLDIRILSSGTYTTYDGTPPVGSRTASEINSIMLLLLKCFYFDLFNMSDAIREAEALLSDTSVNFADAKTAAGNLAGDTKDAMFAGMKLGKAALETADSVESRKESLQETGKEFSNALEKLGEDVDSLVASALTPNAKVTGGIPLIRIEIENASIPTNLMNIDFYAQSISIKPSTQLINGTSLYYDVSLGLISREIVTREMLYGE